MDRRISEPDLPSPAPARVRLIAERIEERLRRHLEARSVEAVRDAVVQGRVVRVGGADASSVVAFKRGVLIIAGVENVIHDE